MSEARHLSCMYGILTEAERSTRWGTYTKELLPLCLWKPTEPTPPAALRSWGGLVEYDRDCAGCSAWRGE